MNNRQTSKELPVKLEPISRWPQALTKYRTRSYFSAPYASTLELLARELAALGAKNVILERAFSPDDFRIDGQLRTGAREQHSGVILSFHSKHGPMSFPCDTYISWQDNLRAIALSLEALRKVDRYKVMKHGQQYRGLKQLTSGDGPINDDEAAQFLGSHSDLGDRDRVACDVLSSKDSFLANYKACAKRLHPDAGGDPKKWIHLQKAYVILQNRHGLLS